MEHVLVCWRCGSELRDDLPRIFPRLEQCTACGSDLHVCVMCHHYAPQYVGCCSHDQAEPVRDTQLANFCAHFRPRPNAQRNLSDPAAGGLGALDALFAGAVEVPAPSVAADPDAAPVDPLDDLFRKPDPEPSAD